MSYCWGAITGAVRDSSIGEFYACMREQIAPIPVTAKEAVTNALICVLSASSIAAINSMEEGFMSPSVLWTTLILTAAAAKTGQTVMRYFEEQRG